MKTFKNLLCIAIIGLAACGLAAQNSEISPKLRELLLRIDSMKKDIASKEYKLAVLEALLEGGPEALVLEMPAIGEMPAYSGAPKVIELPPAAAITAEPALKPQEARSQLASAEAAPDEVPAPVAAVSPPVMAESKAAPSDQPDRDSGQVGVERVYAADLSSADMAAEESVEETTYGSEPESSLSSSEAQGSVEVASIQAGIPPKDCLEIWQSLQKGMTKKKVKSLMGEPDKVSERIIDYWSYVTSQGSKGYIYFDEGKLTGWREPYLGN